MSEIANKSSSARTPGIRKLIVAGLIVLTLLVGGLGRWAATAEISGAVIAKGAIEVEQNRQVVQHPYGGIIENILVDDGDRVQADQVLLQLDSSDLQTEFQIVETQLAELLARQGRYMAERDGLEEINFLPMLRELEQTSENREHENGFGELMAGQQRLFEARHATIQSRLNRLDERISQVRSQIEGIIAQQVAVNDQIKLIGEELVSQEQLLEQGLAQISRVLALRREEVRLRGLAGDLTAQKARAEGQITELQLEKLDQVTARREEAISRLRDIEVRALELYERRNQLLQRLARLEVRSPVSGVVYGMTVHARKAVIRVAEPLLYLVPQDEPLIISARVAPADIDQIYMGQPVTLRFTSFNQRTTPELLGEVSNISADAFKDQQLGISYFQVEVRLNDGELSKLPDGSALVPGMPVDAFVQTDSRTPLEYMLKPFTDYLDRVFRES
jgi:HlyD family type I secretion membrane fusion protein